MALALEDADVAKITLNGALVTARPDGWFTDKSIGTLLLGTLVAGENIIEVEKEVEPLTEDCSIYKQLYEELLEKVMKKAFG